MTHACFCMSRAWSHAALQGLRCAPPVPAHPSVQAHCSAASSAGYRAVAPDLRDGQCWVKTEIRLLLWNDTDAARDVWVHGLYIDVYPVTSTVNPLAGEPVQVFGWSPSWLAPARAPRLWLTDVSRRGVTDRDVVAGPFFAAGAHKPEVSATAVPLAIRCLAAQEPLDWNVDHPNNMRRRAMPFDVRAQVAIWCWRVSHPAAIGHGQVPAPQLRWNLPAKNFLRHVKHLCR